MKNQGKTLEPLARKLRRASEDDAADGAKSRLRLLSDEVVRVVASYLPAVETPGVRPPAAMCYRCGGAEGEVRRLRTWAAPGRERFAWAVTRLEKHTIYWNHAMHRVR